ncbi:MAG: hypothetical protein ACKPJD_23575 [Planctomycetaceae bacterium]
MLRTTIMSHISRVEEVFLAAVAQPDPKLRATFPDAACDQDEDLRRQVETLLAAQPQLGQFLEPSIALGQSENAAATVSAGDRVGHDLYPPLLILGRHFRTGVRRLGSRHPCFSKRVDFQGKMLV